MLLLLASVLIGLWLAKPVIATSPTTEEVILKPIYGPAKPNSIPDGRKESRLRGLRPESGRHSTRAEKQISADVLERYLAGKASPLAPFSSQILASPYWSTIIGICWIEELKCTINPYGSNNFWGMMSGGKIIRYPTMEAGIEAISAFLAKAEVKHPTIESMRGWYCASACTNWEPTVIRIKAEVENL